MSGESIQYILISWLDKKDDPFIRDLSGVVIQGDDGNPVPGPIHGVSLDMDSPYVGKFVGGYVLMTRSPSMAHPDSDTRQRYANVGALINRSEAPFSLKPEIFATNDPTDHAVLYSFCLEVLGKARSEFPQAHFVINTSSGTPAMHTVWVLLSETGQIDGDHTLVQGVPPGKRDKVKPSSVRKIEIGLGSAFGKYRGVRLAKQSSVKAGVIDPGRAKSRSLKRLYDDANLYAGANIPIMILGERGSGKTELAKFIRSSYHNARLTQGSESWPVVNCGQFKGDPNSMRSELFGHVEGAYTGSVGTRDGILKRVDKDVLFLDEVADLDRTSQRLLIRAIEEKTYSPLGSEATIKSDFRLVSATNRPLTELRRSELGEDFFDRISTLRLVVPPLREIPEDLDWIWRKILADTAARAGIEHVDLSEKEHNTIIRRLRKEELPGNYRDVTRLASHILLFVSKEDRFGSRDKALQASFELAFEASVSEHLDESLELARCFAENVSLRSMLNIGVDVPESLTAFKAFLGSEITQHLSKSEVKDKTGIAYETANSWRKSGPND